ncbi:host-nuclease inhibitor Gam family protein [Bacillus licheniformis]|uniref:host-nuclease inhibitor Gam family protein n=1 Tax=Bacillus licheniformis TaxID=1402 RepID=UPI0020C87D5A|nr:host-nuclease inhibitor Gam family protein [Bacillus licheniformis]MCP8973200.1 host-nuclease inhibitor Gam family protein [Bacillus licheniformis]
MPNSGELKNSIYVSSEEELNLDLDAGEGNSKVSNLDEAARYAYGLAETRKSISELQAVADKEIAKWQEKIADVRDWLENELQPLKAKEDYLASQLQMFHINQFRSAKNDSERKRLTSIKLPYGVTLKSRAQADKFEVVNEHTYKKFAKENGLLKAPKEPEINWSDFKKKLVVSEEGQVLNKETGECLDFIKVVPQERKFEVK